MSEPMTDEKFDYLKGDVKRIISQITEHETIKLVEQLIAKVESLKDQTKEDERWIGELSNNAGKLKEENEILISELKEARNKLDSTP